MSGMKDQLGDTPFPRDASQLVRPTDPETSRAAAERIVKQLNKLQRLVWDAFQDEPNGLSDPRLQEKLGSSRSTYRTRRNELCELGLLKNSGRKERIGNSWFVIWVIA